MRIYKGSRCFWQVTDSIILEIRYQPKAPQALTIGQLSIKGFLMLYPQEELVQRDNEILVKSFLDAIFSNQYPGHDRNGLFAQALAEQINCWGFPEFNPQNHLEFSGFLNYLHDVFRDSKYCIEPLLADDKNVFTRFHVQGQHSEEFMGLAASGGIIRFTAIGVFKIHENRINEVLMYNKSVTLTTPKGSVYQLMKAV